MRASILIAFLVAASARPGLLYAQLSPPADLPVAYRGGEIDRAIATQDWTRAEELLAAEVERQPKEAPALLRVLAGVFLADRKPLNAAVAIKKAETLGPLDDRTRFALVLAYVSLKRGDWARPELERLVQSDPSSATYEYWLGRLDYDAGQYGSAVQRFERVIARDASFVRAYDNLGLSYEALNEPDKALAAYAKAVELNRRAGARTAWPPLNMGTLLRQRGELTEAESLLREAVRVDGSLAQAHYQLGVLLEQMQRYEEAVSELTRAAAADVQYAEPHYALARIYRRLGRTSDAKEALAAFARLHETTREESRR
jgi:tetratricopeptide (TPR) repeat protein